MIGKLYLTIMLLYALGVTNVAEARVWISRDGQHALEASFVRMDDKVVTLQTPQNEYRKVKLENLSELDQLVARHFAKSQPEAIQVVVTGVGLTAQEALDDAFRKAVQDAVGALVDARTVVQNDVLEQDRILVLRDGYVAGFKELATARDGGLIRRQIRATVHRCDVGGVSVEVDQDGNARFLYSIAFSKVERHRIGTAMLQDVLDGFSADLLEARLLELGRPEVIPGDYDRVRVSCRVVVRIDRARYRKLQERMVYILGALAEYQGTVNVTRKPILETSSQHRLAGDLLRRHFLRGMRDGEGNTVAAFHNLATLDNPRVSGTMPDVTTIADREYGSTLFSVYDPGGMARDRADPRFQPRTWGTPPGNAVRSGVGSGAVSDAGSEPRVWRWFELNVQPTILEHDIDIAVRYTDEGGETVHEERLELGPRAPALSVQSNMPKLRTVMIAPEFLYHVSEGYLLIGSRHADSLTFERTMKLSLDDLSRIHTARALVIPRRRAKVEQQTHLPPAVTSPPRAAQARPARQSSPVPTTPQPTPSRAGRLLDVETFRLGHITLEMKTMVVSDNEVEFLFRATNVGSSFDPVSSWLSSNSQAVLERKLQQAGGGTGSWSIEPPRGPLRPVRGVVDFRIVARRS
ncbi:MAG: hypothetical protein RBS80_28785 [Thermoguttaceae bacterium]|nr:hypothetical protein [Thermoguttaceae bacterium]